MRQQQQLNWQQRSIILGIIWIIGVICDRLWFKLDNSVPAWDQADYLNGVLNYWEALQTPQWFNGQWWRSFWLLSNKIPPLNYILTVPSINLFGTSEDAATTVMLFYSAVLLLSVYGLGVVLFDATVGLWAAGLCQLIPGLYSHRLEFILDYPLTTVITFSYCLLTIYFFSSSKSWLWAILAGISVGLAVLTKQTALFFLLPVILTIFITFITQRQWWRLIQLIIGGLSAIAIAFPWYRTNWLLILTSGKRATVDSAIAEGDPALNTLAAWTYYLKLLPQLLTWNLLLIPIAGFIFYVISKLAKKNNHRKFPTNYFARDQWIWLTTYLFGGYLLSSLNINKDPRYILPLLPILAIILAVGLLLWRSRWRNYILTATASLGIILMLLNIFPLPLMADKLNPQGRHYPYTGEPFPHPQVITTIKNTSPYLRLVLGVLPSTPEINQHNFSFYGEQSQGKISGRQVGVREEEILADSRSLDWFLTKTGDNGSIPASQPAMVQLIESGKDFQLQQGWQLPDKTQLKLYHRYFPTVEVQEFNQASNNNQNLSLEKVELPAVSPNGVPIPITYAWVGSPKLLQTGIVLLTWRQTEDPNAFWIHDHALGMGALNFPPALDNQPAFKVIERTAMQIPLDIKPGKYNLEATYLDRHTGKTQNLPLPNITLTIDPQATATAAPELDLGTQLRNIAPRMAENIKGLEAIFTQTARINQYDAQQDYLPQVEKALSYRLEHNQVNIQQQVNWLYGVALSQVLQQNVEGAIASFKKITTLDPQNPYGYAYLGFVYLYDWQPKPADIVLNTAIKINPNIAEIKTLKGVASLMQGRFIKAWKMLNNHQQ
ncbi:family 39 glycosyl transferase [Chondrocystis sp. NIES-4102]|nr:family 39 glycosyl transferase [Chondrocystis sp. NIES-4102]